MKHDEKNIGRTNPELLRLEEVAVYLGVSLRTVERFVKDDLIRVTPLGKRTKRVSLTDLQDFIERMKETKS